MDSECRIKGPNLLVRGGERNPLPNHDVAALSVMMLLHCCYIPGSWLAHLPFLHATLYLRCCNLYGISIPLKKDRRNSSLPSDLVKP